MITDEHEFFGGCWVNGSVLKLIVVLVTQLETLNCTL